MKNLEPLRFHKVHGGNIKVSNNDRIATLNGPDVTTPKSFVFSSRPILVNEKVTLNLKVDLKNLNSPFGFGFADCDPRHVADFIPKLCGGYCVIYNWLNHLHHKFHDGLNVFHFFVNSSGEVYYGVNDKDMGPLVTKTVNINNPLWAIIQLSRGVSTVKLLKSKKNGCENLKSLTVEGLLVSPTHTLADNTESRENPNPVIKLESPGPSGQSAENSDLLSSSCSSTNETLITNISDLRFHRVHGKYVNISGNLWAAKCHIPSSELAHVQQECYAFSSRSIRVNEKVSLRLERVSKKCLNEFSFGFTNCDPEIMPDLMNKLCPHVDCIIDSFLIPLRGEFCTRDNFLFFYVNESGDIHYGINGEEKAVEENQIDIKHRVWAVIKLTDHVSSVIMEHIVFC